MGKALGVKITNELGKYLGVFVDGDNVVKENGAGLIDRLECRLRGWKASLLSQAGICTLIKAVLQFDPIYKMSNFQLRKKDTERMNSVITNFFWGFKGDKKKIYLLKKNVLRRHTRDGGLGL